MIRFDRFKELFSRIRNWRIRPTATSEPRNAEELPEHLPQAGIVAAAATITDGGWRRS